MKINIPSQDVPVLLPNGRMDPVWYEFLKRTSERRFSTADLTDIDTTGIADGDVLIWSDLDQKFEPGAN